MPAALGKPWNDIVFEAAKLGVNFNEFKDPVRKDIDVCITMSVCPKGNIWVAGQEGISQWVIFGACNTFECLGWVGLKKLMYCGCGRNERSSTGEVVVESLSALDTCWGNNK